MDKGAFRLLHDAERSWWYRGRKEVVSRVLTRYIHTSQEGQVLDVGAGFGGMRDLLARYGIVDAMEPEDDARAVAKTRGYRRIVASLNEIHSFRESYDLIGAFDVVEHIEDDKAFVRFLHGLVKIGGHVVVTVPANPWLWSEHDTTHHHFRRYTKKELHKLFTEAGYTPIYLGYWNMSLLPLAALARMLGKSGEGSMAKDSFIDKVCSLIVRTENKLIPAIRLPLGVSLVALFKKENH